MRQTHGGQRQEQIHLGDAKFEMLALGAGLPFLGRGDMLLAEQIGDVPGREQAAPIDPGPRLVETVTSGEVVTMALAKAPSALAMASKMRPNPAWVAPWRGNFDAPAAVQGNLGGDQAPPPFGGEGNGGEERLQFFDRRFQTLEPVPFVARTDLHDFLEAGHLLGGHQPGMVVLMPGQRQPIALDGISQETDRPITRSAFEGVDQRGQVMTAEIGHQAAQILVGPALDQRRDQALVAQIVEQAAAPGGAALIGQGRIKLVGAGVDPVAQSLAARFGEGGLEQRAIFEDPDLPSHRLEQLGNPFIEAFPDHRVEALAVVVDDPPAILQTVLPAFQQTFEDVAFVQFGVADDGDHAAVRPLPAAQLILGPQIILNQAGKNRHRRPETHRAGRKIDVVLVLGARRIGLGAAETAGSYPASQALLPSRY